MKLVVQIPCLNEAQTLPETLAEIPRDIEGVDEVELLVIDDGSTDDTAAVARRHGADHVIQLKHTQGLAHGFQTGVERALELGADIIVNTDGDNQYPGRFIPRLVKPVVEGQADIVIGDRQVAKVPHFSPLKRWLQRLGTASVRRFSGTDVKDATSGFRALSREAALQLIVLSDYTYTLETIVQAGKKNLKTASVPIEANRTDRPSRLFRSMFGYIWRSATTLLRLHILFEPLRFFSIISFVLMLAGTAIGVRFLYYYFSGVGSGKIQSLILAAILLIIGFNVFVIGLLSANLATNRKLLEGCLYRLRRMETHDRRAGASPQGSQASRPSPAEIASADQRASTGRDEPG
jgi:glycosyltransferase involved in cell wall biosynthesis